MVKFNRAHSHLIIIIIGSLLLFYGIINNSTILKTILNNFFIILGSVLVILGIIYLIFTEVPSDSPKAVVMVNILMIVATILAALLGAYLGTSGSRDLIKEQNILAKQNAAKAFYFDILAFTDQISDDITTYENNIKYKSCWPILLKERIYVGNNAYNNYKNEISSFDPNLSLELFNFYRVLDHSEELRQELIKNHEEMTNHNFTYSMSDWVTSPLNPHRSLFVLNASPYPMSFNTLTSKDLYDASKRYQWGPDEDLKDCILFYYDPRGSQQKNDAIIQDISLSIELEREIILNYNHTPSLLYNLSKEINQ
jgi:hypothetical protein